MFHILQQKAAIVQIETLYKLDIVACFSLTHLDAILKNLSTKKTPVCL